MSCNPSSSHLQAVPWLTVAIFLFCCWSFQLSKNECYFYNQKVIKLYSYLWKKMIPMTTTSVHLAALPPLHELFLQSVGGFQGTCPHNLTVCPWCYRSTCRFSPPLLCVSVGRKQIALRGLKELLLLLLSLMGIAAAVATNVLWQEWIRATMSPTWSSKWSSLCHQCLSQCQILLHSHTSSDPFVLSVALRDSAETILVFVGIYQFPCPETQGESQRTEQKNDPNPGPMPCSEWPLSSKAHLAFFETHFCRWSLVLLEWLIF